MQYWFADVPGWIWSALFLGVMFCINFFSAKSFGEAEFWFASVKVCAVVAFIITGFMLAVGVLPGHDAVGLKNWNLNGDGSFVGGFTAFLGVAMVSAIPFRAPSSWGWLPANRRIRTVRFRPLYVRSSGASSFSTC